ncbi:hypothetical protein [Methylorubrum podarium]|uniref:hypothetical protein n=1 Tax=Methylorubrum podarium TaxID=200476 RepID=UPI001EE36F4E|nr:hypothetical protein [Methylorubrum podarium]
MIPWDAIADLDMTLSQSTMVTRLLLPPGASWPERVPGGRNVKLDRKRRIVTVSVGLPRGMPPQDFADLIGRYRAAHQARRILAEHAPAEAALGEAGAPRTTPSEAQPA